jgi:hypothetical protein
VLKDGVYYQALEKLFQLKGSAGPKLNSSKYGEVELMLFDCKIEPHVVH